TKSADEFQTLVSALKERIGVKGGTDNIYTITFEDHSREMAEKVVTAILDNFVEGSLGLQGDDTQKAEIGLAGEIAEYEKRLEEAEAALAKFRTENLGYMPNELGD